MAKNYTNDIVNFLQDLYPVAGEYGPRMMILPFLETWLYRAFPLPEGNPAARNVLDSRSKKQGKSALAGGVALFMAARRRGSEVVIAAADQDQSRDRVFKAVRFAVENHAIWRNAKVYRDVIELDNGSIVTALAFDWKGAAGGNYNAVIFDELHVYASENHRRLYDELIIPPSVKSGVRWIASYAGFLGESTVLWEIWQKALGGVRDPGDLPIFESREASLLALIDQGEASWRMPWSSPAYMRELQQTERPNSYRRLWLNEWVSNESQFITPEAWEACYSPDVRPVGAGGADRRRMVLGADASTSRDLTALVGVAYDRRVDLADVVYCRVWKPQKGILRLGKPTIDLSSTIGAEILKLHKAGLVEAVYYDPYQLHSIALDLEKGGVQMVELPQTGQRVESDQALYDAIVGRSIRHYGDPTLNEHVNNAVAIETARGFRLAKERTTRKIDAAVALSMSHYGALQRQKGGGQASTMPDIFYEYEGASTQDFVDIGGNYVYLPNRNRAAHPPGVTWRNCPRRNRGCESCIAELEIEGYYDQLEAEAERLANRPEPNSPEEQAELNQFLSRIQRIEGENKHVYDLQRFTKQVISKLARPR